MQLKTVIANFFNNKKDIYGYLKEKNISTLNESIGRLVLSNDPLPRTMHELDNFKMPINTPKNFEHEENSQDHNSRGVKNSQYALLRAFYVSVKYIAKPVKAHLDYFSLPLTVGSLSYYLHPSIHIRKMRN